MRPLSRLRHAPMMTLPALDKLGVPFTANGISLEDVLFQNVGALGVRLESHGMAGQVGGCGCVHGCMAA
jgi:hypothetical protein